MESGDTIGKYQLVRPLERGGMGEVWLATASGAGGFAKTVVLKTLLPELAGDRMFVEMLANEARVCAKLHHPNLIEVFDFTEHGGVYLLAMEHVNGQPLSRILKTAIARGCELPPWFPLRVAWECCRGLQCAHAQGIIHCDLSPSNVMVTFDGITKILDFGVAHSSAHGPKADRLKGKFPYMAPERIESLTTDRRTDIYSLGVMLYLLFTQRLPFEASDDHALLRKVVKGDAPPPSELCAIDPRIEAVILRAMQADPSARYQSADAVLAALEPCLAGGVGAPHEVAAFIARLFAARTSPTGVPTLECELISVDVDVDIESSDFAIPVAAPRELSARALIAAARASSAMRPLVQPPPLIAGARASSSIPRLPRAIVPAFADAPSARDAQTSVQSLFDRPPIDDDDPPGPEAADLVDASRDVGATAEMPRDPDAADVAGFPEPRDQRRGVFAGYAAPPPSTPTAWPWPRSRTPST